MFGAATVPGLTDLGAPAPTTCWRRSRSPSALTVPTRSGSPAIPRSSPRRPISCSPTISGRCSRPPSIASSRAPGCRCRTGVTSTGSLMLDPASDNAIADALAAIHNLNFPVADADRLKRVRERLKDITALSRRNWEAILAETDNDHELLPNLEPGRPHARREDHAGTDQRLGPDARCGRPDPRGPAAHPALALRQGGSTSRPISRAPSAPIS